MSFLVILLVLLVDKFSDWRPRVQHDGPWLARLRQAESNQRLQHAPWLGLLLLVLLPVLLLGLLLAALEPLAYGWLSLPLHLLILLYSLGRGHAKSELGAFRDAWRRGDQEAAALAAERDLSLQEQDPPSLLQAVQTRLLWKSYEGFSPSFSGTCCWARWRRWPIGCWRCVLNMLRWTACANVPSSCAMRSTGCRCAYCWAALPWSATSSRSTGRCSTSC